MNLKKITMIKRMIIVILSFSFISCFLVGCTNGFDTQKPTNTEDDELSRQERIREDTEAYTMSEIIDANYDGYWEMLEYQGIPDVFQIIDELISQGYYEDVDRLRAMPDKIGYYPAALFGNYISDSNHVIHDTNGPCFETIPSSELIVIGPYYDVEDVKEEINDDDTILNEFVICEKCLTE